MYDRIKIFGFFLGLCLFMPVMGISQERIPSDIQEQIDKLEPGAAYLFLDSIVANLPATEPEPIQLLVKKQIQLARKIQADSLLAKSNLKLGQLLRQNGQADSSLHYYNRAVHWFLASGKDIDAANILYRIGVIYARTANYRNALAKLQEAYEIYNKHNDLKGLGDVNIALGNIFYYQDNYSKSLEYYKESLEKRKMLGDTSGTGISLSNMATIYEAMGDTIKAIRVLKEAESILQETSNLYALGQTHNNLGTLYYNMGSYDTAMYYYKQTLEQFTQLGREGLKAILLNNMALIETERENYESARKKLLQALEISQRLQLQEFRKEVLFNLNDLFLRQNEFKKAYFYFRDYYTLKDSLDDVERERNIMELQMQYEDEQRLLKQQKQEELNRHLAERNRLKSYILISVIVLSLIIILLLYRNFRSNKKSNALLRKKNKEIGKQKDLLEKAIHELKISQQQNVEILEAIPDIYFVIDEKGRFINYHANDVNQLPMKPTSFLNKRYDELLDKERSELFATALKKARDNDKLQIIEGKIFHDTDKTEVYYEARIMPSKYGRFLITARDITQRKQTESELIKAREEAEKATEMKSMFLASLSHEIRTPLSSIIGIASVLEEMNLTPEQKEFVDVIAISGNNLLNLINNILDFSKIEDQELRLSEIELDVREIVDEITSILQLQAHESEVELIPQWDDRIPETLIGDPGRLKQILINLISNAIKFSKKGKVFIKTHLFDEDQSHYMLKFEIQDTGIGVALEQRDKLFKAFSQADTSIARKYGGTGLGLAISKYFTEMMGGSIGLESEKDKGSTFWFTARFEKTHNQKGETKTEHKVMKENAQKTDNMKKLNILLVEDNLLNQKFASAILKKAGHQVDLAENGKIGFEKFRENNYDIVLMDIQMPVMDGIEATKQIREYEKTNQLEPVPIVAVTAYAMEGDEERFYKAGIDDYLRKPYKADQMLDILPKK